MKEESPYREDWTRDIHDRLADFESDAPEGLWDAISSRLDAPPATDAVVGTDTPDAPDAMRHRTIRLTLRRAVALAAAVAVILTGAVMLVRDGDPTESLRQAVTAPEQAIAEVPGQADPSRDNSGATVPEPRTTPPATTAEKALIAAATPPTADEDAQSAETEAPAPVRENNASEDESITSQNGKGNPDENPAVPTLNGSDGSNKDTDAGKAADEDIDKTADKAAPRDNGDRLADARADAALRRKERMREARGLLMGAYASGGAAAYAARGHANGATASIMAVNNTNWEDSPLLGILLYNRDKETETRVRHHQPIRAGVSFTYMINERFGIESGITYTLLSSDMRDGSDRHFYDGRQRLHYLGIPLNVKYDIVSWRRFGIYGSAGLLAEQCIAGHIRKEYVLNGSSYRSSVDGIGTKPFQLSANLSAGVRFDFTPTVGIYAEPGLSYYFDDGTTLETIYKQRPLNFNLNVGIRFTVGR